MTGCALGHRQRGRTDLFEFGRDAAVEHIAVPASPQFGEQVAKLVDEQGGRGRHPAVEAAQCAAQPPDADPELMDVFHPKRPVAVDESDRIVGYVGEAFVDHLPERLDNARFGRVFGPRSLAHPPERRALGQAVAAFGLAARIVDETKPLSPPFREGKHRDGRSRNQFELDFPDPQPRALRKKPPFVEGDLDDRALGADPARNPPDLGLEAHVEPESVLLRISQDLRQLVADLGTGMGCHIVAWAGADRLMFETLDGAVPARLQGLYPAATLAAQSPGDARLGQPAVFRVEIAGGKRASLEAGRFARHFGRQGRTRLPRDKELQFDFGVGAHRTASLHSRSAARRRAGTRTILAVRLSNRAPGGPRRQEAATAARPGESCLRAPTCAGDFAAGGRQAVATPWSQLENWAWSTTVGGLRADRPGARGQPPWSI